MNGEIRSDELCLSVKSQSVFLEKCASAKPNAKHVPNLSQLNVLLFTTQFRFLPTILRFYKFTLFLQIHTNSFNKFINLEENYCAQKEQQLFDSINKRRDAEHQTVRAKFTRFQMDSRKFHRKPKIRMIILNQFLYQLISYQIHFLAFSLLN